ncbi:MAG: hypothetical protein IJY69_01495 [Clostridia bacterium]|nr:hypothetical protein [Clostridia bacterium]
MTKLLELLFIFYAIWLVWNTVSLLLKRLLLIKRLRSLTAETNAVVRFYRHPLIKFGRPSTSPDLSVKVGSTLYLIRLYNGGGIDKVVHFASDHFTVRFSRMKTATYVRRGRAMLISAASRGFAVGTRVIPICPMDVSTLSGEKGVKAVPVWIFNPAPGEVSLVTEEKTSIKLAFTGDTVYGEQIFTASTFAAYAERVFRDEKRQAEEAVSSDFDYSFI